MLHERQKTKGLGRIVPSCDNRNPAFCCIMIVLMLEFTGHKAVKAVREGGKHIRTRPSADNAHPVYQLIAERQDQGILESQTRGDPIRTAALAKGPLEPEQPSLIGAKPWMS